MLAWLSANLVNIILIAAIAAAAALIVRGMVRAKKAGRSSCGGNCAGCGACKGACAGCSGCASRV